MSRFKLANVLLEDTSQFHEAPLLYCRSAASVVYLPDAGEWLLRGPGEFDFTTFFNALSVRKWETYTVASDFHLHLELRGDACTVCQTTADSLSHYSEKVAGSSVDLGPSDVWQELDLDIMVDDLDVLEGFAIDSEGGVSIRNGYYWADVAPEDVRPVELALATTTFRKEGFITRNISLVSEKILGSSEPVSDHFHMHVVDNGRTLDQASLEVPGISIHPNDNVGGSGGFARGMICAMEQEPKATHVLLMDDDVEVSPESIIRTYNLLAIVNDGYAEAFVSGAMMSYDEPDLFCEDLGYMTPQGVYRPVKPSGHMGYLHDYLQVESHAISADDPVVQSQAYASWWYCCIPIATIEREGLPLPLFVRSDDMEYSLRCKPRFITMGGICIWHMAFRMRYNAAVERYQCMRNGLIAQSTTGAAPLSDFLVELEHNVRIELMKFDYADAALVLDAFEDYMRGPGYFSAKGVGESRFMDANSNKEQLVPLADLDVPEGVDLAFLTSDRIEGDVPFEGDRGNYLFRRRFMRIFRETLNGQLGNMAANDAGPVIIEAAGWSYLRGKICGSTTIVAVDAPTKRGVVRHKDPERCREVWDRFRSDLERYDRDKDRIRAEYAAARARLTSVAFWKGYLGID
ncbi:MAG: glycosyltransferase family 2 protein [Atopobiaceae bacterium]|jgi:hypothetical protein|nr:glycosyltransferase family 2 protein [Atopobiaceae bacterium]MCH4180737.1 glycosyltransferase family 2 protein [Atopobiaceae bacterium]MCH4215101.1 glycosyltransferase family 2 protein [Atopobiaceae bacterium]MCH4230512.1 glycosyltransferase family 2 protein [Atopobiaceae bacterium]MCH4277231.1 glycosyltransferase family 2 protein [Atopobiaceae bacterium]